MLQIYPDPSVGQWNTPWAHTEAVALLWTCTTAPVPARADVGASTTLQPLGESLHHGSYISVSLEVQKYIIYKSLLLILRTLGVNLQPSSQLGPNPGPSLGISHREQLSRFWLWSERPHIPLNRITPIVRCNINVTFYIASQNLTLHSTNKSAMAPYLMLVHCTSHSVLQNSLAGLWPFAFVRPPDSRRNGNKLTDYLVMNNSPDVVNPIFCWTSAEAVDGCSYHISLLSKEKNKSWLLS